jgi:hypothetical protein
LAPSDRTPKPSYTALKNLIDMFEDTDTSFTPQGLEYELSGDTVNVLDVLFQKSDGRYLLALWQEADSYDLEKKQPIAVADRSVDLTLPFAFDSVRVYYPCDPATLSPQPAESFASVSKVSLKVPDHVMIVECVANQATGTRLKAGSFPSSVAPILRISGGERVTIQRTVIGDKGRKTVLYDLQGKRVRHTVMK